MRRIMGIDPGLRITGYGVVELPVASIDPRLVEAGFFKLNAKLSLEDRLAQLHDDLVGVIEESHPDELAVEKLYSHYAHPRTAILMGHARGVILMVAALRKLPVTHLPATLVKKAFTGYGHASKEQMQRAVQTQFRLPELPQPADVADAIAIATTHARRIAMDRL